MELSNGLKLPMNWSAVTVDQFIELRGIDTSDFNSWLSYKLEQLAILTETYIDNDCWNNVDTDELMLVFDKMEWVDSDPRTKFKEIGPEDLRFKGYSSDLFTWGEFICLEYYFREGYIKYLPEICAVMYRKTLLNEWGHTIWEPLKYDIQERSKLFKTIPITDVFGILVDFLKLQYKIRQDYKTMVNSADDEVVEEVILSEEEKIAQEKQNRLNKYASTTDKGAKWAWEKLIDEFCQGDITKFDAVTDMPLIFVLNQIAMKRDLS